MCSARSRNAGRIVIIGEYFGIDGANATLPKGCLNCLGLEGFSTCVHVFLDKVLDWDLDVSLSEHFIAASFIGPVLRYCRNVRPTWVKFDSKDTKESDVVFEVLSTKSKKRT